MSIRSWRSARRARHALSNERGDAEYTYERLAAEDGANDPTFFVSRPKLLGLFMVEAARLQFAYTASDGTSWKEGAPYLDVTIPPVAWERVTLDALHRSHHTLAQYVGLNGLHAHTPLAAVGAVTSARFAKVAERSLGFSVADVPADRLPAGYVEGAQGIYERFVDPAGRKPFEPAFIYQTPEALLQSQEGTDPGLAALVDTPPPRKYDHIPELDVYAF